MTAHTENYNAASGVSDDPSKMIVDAVRQTDISRRISELESIKTERNTAATQAQQKLYDMEIEGTMGALKKLGMGVQVVGSLLGGRSQKMLKVLGGVGTMVLGLGESWMKAVNKERTEHSYESAVTTVRDVTGQLEAIDGGRGIERGGPSGGVASGPV